MAGLPDPRIPYIDEVKTQLQTKTQEEVQAQTSKTPKQPSKPRQHSFGGDMTTDPWVSAAVKNIPPSTASHTMKPAVSDEFTSSAVNGIPRTTSTFTTASTREESSDQEALSTSAGLSGNAWGSYNGNNSGGFRDQAAIGGGFGDSGDSAPARQSHQPQRSVSASVAIPKGTGELVTISTLPDKEGVFLFQHHNYEVKTIRRGNTVVRRYSDFVWLLDCLQKRYPFRRLPLLPPKRVQGESV